MIRKIYNLLGINKQNINEDNDNFTGLILHDYQGVPVSHNLVIDLTDEECDKMQDWFKNKDLEKIHEFIKNKKEKN